MSSSHSILFVCVFAALLLSNCTSEEESDTFFTKSGYKVEVIERTSIIPAVSTEYIMYTSDIMIGDTVVNSSRLGAPFLFYKVEPNIDSKDVSPVAEALQLMKDQDSVVLWYPLKDEAQKPDWFGNADFLEYRIRIHKFLDEAAYATQFQVVRNEIQEQALHLQSLEQEVAQFSSDIYTKYQSSGTSDWVDFGQGVRGIIHEKGSGKIPIPGSYVSVAYYGRMASDGTSFSNSFRDGRAFSFKVGLGEAIDGWERAITHLPSGSKATLYVPSALAYGKRGFPPEIGPDEDLLFYMEVMKVL